MKFIYALSEGIHVVIEAGSFSEAQKEYEKIKSEADSTKIKLIHRPVVKSKKRGLKEYLIELKEKDFFNSPRSLRDIKEKLAEMAIHYPTTTLPSYLNPLVQNGFFKRTRGKQGETEVWLYENGGSS